MAEILSGSTLSMHLTVAICSEAKCHAAFCSLRINRGAPQKVGGPSDGMVHNDYKLCRKMSRCGPTLATKERQSDRIVVTRRLVRRRGRMRVMDLDDAKAVEIVERPGPNALTLYADPPAALRAHQALEHWSRQRKWNKQVHNSEWQFDLLADPGQRERALQEATTADVVVLADGDDTLPLHVKLWLRMWREGRGPDPGQLIVSLDHRFQSLGEFSMALRYIRELTEHSKIDVFPHYAATPTSPEQESSRQIKGGLLKTLRGKIPSRREIPPRWGLNE
jgi:hypothetical protein